MLHPRSAVCLGAIATMAVACRCTPSDDTASPPSAPEETRLSDPPTPPLSGDPPLPGIEHPDPEVAARLARVRDARGRPGPLRTEHLRDGVPEFTNRLVEEGSPYLLQHAHNPVNWFPWGPEAFARARRDDRPIFLSIGYATCHWCHVMERESFEDPEIAAYINRHFIPIKVDREERPDIDAIYMRAVQLLTGRGGWPMTVLLAPDGRPFFAGTYFPPRGGARGSRVGLLEILQAHVEAYVEQRGELLAHAAELSRAVARSVAPSVPGDVPGVAPVIQAAREMATSYDPNWAGFGRAPKFPLPARLGLLARYARRTGDAEARRMLAATLRRMAEGGMYDQLGGGFHRYSTDARWRVPHFEKMLYDNAQLAVVYLEGWQLLGDPDLLRWAREILDYVAREMTSPEGGFYSATDADSARPDGVSEEGWFFTWTPTELREALDPEAARRVGAYFGVTEEGDLGGRSVLHVARSTDEVAASLGVTPEALRATIAAARPRLLSVRASRPAPALDDKILTEWNGLMIGAFARGALALGEARYLEAARRAASFALEHLRDGEGRLLRSFRDGRARHPAFLEDHAALLDGLLALYEASGELRWLEEALGLEAALEERFADREGGAYFATADDAERLLAREQPDEDGALPSGNALAAHALLHLAALTDDDAHRQRALRLFAAFSTPLTHHPSALTHMVAALERLHDAPREVAVVLPDGAEGRALLEVLGRAYLPNAARLVVRASELEAHARRVPWLAGKLPMGGAPTAYVCERGRCQLPTTDPATFARQLASPPAPLGEPPPRPLAGALP